MLLLILAAITLLGLFALFVDFTIGHRQLLSLADVTPIAGPRVTIVAAARDEARNIEAAVRSLLRLDYPSLEVVLVNDRSTDDTAAILERLAADQPRLKVVHITELPDGWLGKNHALFVGAAKASGEMLLFTDADIVFEPTTIGRAVAVMEGRGPENNRGPERAALHHLAAIPDARVTGVALKAFVAAFGVFFSMYARPWKARDPKSSSHIGIGAFNLIRASTYRAIGTHQAIAMRPDDDIKLGKLVKKHGFRQDVVYGQNFVVVEWYRSLGEMVDGLMKNAFAGVEYSLAGVVASTAALVAIYVWPWVSMFVSTGAVRTINIVNVVTTLAIFWTSARFTASKDVNPLYGLAFPAAALLFAYVIWRSAFIAVWSGHITWRGTAYPLAALRANRV